MKQRFTIDGSEALEEHLALTNEKVLREVRGQLPPGKLEALLLGGGYGRGEGGVLKTDLGDQPYNDLEYYLFLNGNLLANQRKHGAAIHALGQKLSTDARVEVELHLFSQSKLSRSPVSMFYYDLLLGHHLVFGEETAFAGGDHHRQAQRIPLCEATRLLMNRCSGLLFSRERLQRELFTLEDADFVSRNLAKARLAFGDVVLTALGRYHWSCLERHKRLELLPADAAPWLPVIRKHHAAGVEFKLHPKRATSPRKMLQREFLELAPLGQELWLWLENRRLNTEFTSVRDYATSRKDKCPETSGLRNRLVNANAFGLTSLFRHAGDRNPRQRLFHALPLLLWVSNGVSDPNLLACIQTELKTQTSGFSDLVGAYEQLWHRFG